MSSAGHVFDAINRAKYNASLKQSRQAHLAKLKDIYYNELDAYKNMRNNYKEPTADELKQIKESIRTKLAKEKRQSTIKSIIVSVVIITSLAILAVNKL